MTDLSSTYVQSNTSTLVVKMVYPNIFSSHMEFWVTFGSFMMSTIDCWEASAGAERGSGSTLGWK